MLLPPDPTQEEQEEEDPREDLARRLLEYQKFKEIAEDLHDKAKWRRDLFSRQVDDEARARIVEESKEVFFEANLFDLINALTKALERTPEEILHEIVKEEHTVDQKIHEILHYLPPI